MFSFVVVHFFLLTIKHCWGNTLKNVNDKILRNGVLWYRVGGLNIFFWFFCELTLPLFDVEHCFKFDVARAKVILSETFECVAINCIDYKIIDFVDSEEETNNKLVDVLNTSKVNEIWSIVSEWSILWSRNSIPITKIFTICHPDEQTG